MKQPPKKITDSSAAFKQVYYFQNQRMVTMQEGFIFKVLINVFSFYMSTPSDSPLKKGGGLANKAFANLKGLEFCCEQLPPCHAERSRSKGGLGRVQIQSVNLKTMINLKTKYMGIEIDNPIIIGASNLVNDLDRLKKAEQFGAAAVVYKSLFEEQMQLEEFQMDEKLTEFDNMHAEMITTHPSLEFAGPEEHLLNLRKAKESVSIPLIASINAVESNTWLSYAKLIAETGVDALELNFYHTPSDFKKEASQIEDEQINIVKEICNNSPIPVSVKLSPDYSNILNFIQKLDNAGVDGVVLFNSFYQPDIDVSTEKHIKLYNFSNEGDYRKSLRFAGLLFENIKADICSSHGVFSGADVIKLILAGSTCVQVVSTLYKNGIPQIEKIKSELLEWMESKSYNSIEDFRGKLSKTRLTNDPFVYKRAQYVDLLIHSDEIFGIPK